MTLSILTDAGQSRMVRKTSRRLEVLTAVLLKVRAGGLLSFSHHTEVTAIAPRSSCAGIRQISLGTLSRSLSIFVVQMPTK